MVNSITFVQNFHQHKASNINIHNSLFSSNDAKKQNLESLPPSNGGTGYFCKNMKWVEPVDVP